VVKSPGFGQLTGIESLSAHNIWAIGIFEDTYVPNPTLIEHWNGSNWSAVPSPNPGTYDNILDGIEALSPHNI
jgi:hypothetical protein